VTNDPLRSFDITQEEWDEVNSVVRKEGAEEWDAFAPMVFAAIEQGFLDNHLQMLGRWARGRYLYLKDNSQLPAIYAEAIPSAPKAVGRAQVTTGVPGPQSTTPKSDNPNAEGIYSSYLDALNDLNQAGVIIQNNSVSPMHEVMDVYRPLLDEFVVRGWVFKKSDFVGKYFISPVPYRPGAIFRIDKVNRENFAVTCIASRGRGAGTQRTFRVESSPLLKFPSS
jgi:hypothetical protein